jgi:hypothetical protein
MKTITNETSPVDAVWHSCLGGSFRLRITRDDGPGHRSADVLDDAGNVIGNAYDYIYGGSAFSVWTKPFAGYVPMSQIEFV